MELMGDNPIDIEAIAIALSFFRNKNGYQWKAKLKESLLNGKQRVPELCRFRNTFGFDVLNKIKTVSTSEEIAEVLKASGRIK